MPFASLFCTHLRGMQLQPQECQQKVRCIQQELPPETYFEVIYSKMLARVEYEKEDRASTKYRHFDKSEQWFPCYMWSRD